MENDLRLQEPPCRKQITFDLGEHKLEDFYPRPSKSVAWRYYAKAWEDVKRFMTAREFDRIEYSVYASQKEMTNAEVNAFIIKMVKAMPWLCNCLKEIHVTNIVEQHDLMRFISILKMELKEEKTE